MADIQAEITGLEPVLARLKELGPGLQRRALRTGVRKGANIVRKSAQDAAPKRSGAMAKNIRVQFASRTARREGGVAFRIGVRGGAQQPGSETRYARSKKGRAGGAAAGGSTWYWRLVEFGTSKMAAQPFMRPALQKNISKIIDTVARDVDDGIDHELKRQARALTRSAG